MQFFNEFTVVVATKKTIMKCEFRVGKKGDFYIVILGRVFLQRTPSFHAHDIVVVRRTRWQLEVRNC